MDVRPPRILNRHISWLKLLLKSGHALAHLKISAPSSNPPPSWLNQGGGNITIPPLPKENEKKLTLQSLQPRFPQSILWQHPSDRPLQHLPPAPLPHHTLHIQTLQRPWPRRLLIIQLLFHLPSRHIQICASRGYHIIPAISRWVPDRFMFAH